MEKCTLRATVYLFMFLLVWEETFYFGNCASNAYSGDDSFTIQHVSTGKCLVAKAMPGSAESRFNMTLDECDSPGGSQWKWGSGHRLFHTGASQCLGLEVKTKSLSLFPCDSLGYNMLWWRCLDEAIHTDYQMGLAVSDGRVLAKRDSLDTWRRDGLNETICQWPMRIVHTANGTSAGKPCDFPFFYNGSWYHECLPDDESPGLSWCATTSNYDNDKQMGYCLRHEEGCKMLFSGPEGGPCYELVSQVAVTWQEALDSCRSQGADLLSVSDAEQNAFPVSGSIPDRMWIGLHQLDTSQGWQWSDGSPLDNLRWDEEMPVTSSLRESDCGVMNSKHYYESESCDKKLPYICKKNVSSAQPAPTEPLVYKSTKCEKGWTPWNMFCYKLVKEEAKAFAQAEKHCEDIGGGLASLHGLDSIEMISIRFHSGVMQDVWIGLMGTGNPAILKWSDKTPVSFTYWDRNQPIQPSNSSGCVFYSGQSHGWNIGNCDSELPFMCKKKGEVTESFTTGCPTEGNWKQHGNSCYKVDSKEVLFKDRCDVIINNRFEQAFINRLLGEEMNLNVQHFWIGLQDIKGTAEYRWVSQNGTGQDVAYTNWGWFEPEHAGGCAVISTAKPLGKWAIKNCTLFKAGTICKMNIGTPLSPDPEPDPTLPCPDGWTSRPGISYCYKVFHGERVSRKRSWEEAEKFCEALGAHLPSFSHPKEMSALHYVMRDSISDDRFFWVGLNRRNPSATSWEWSDNRPVSSAIFPKEFNQEDEYNRHCAAFKTVRGKFRSFFVFLLQDMAPPFYAKPFHCDARLEWACQIPRGKTPKNPEWYKPGGHHNTSVFVDGHEFWFVTEPKLPHDEADMYCSGNGSRLATPGSFPAVRRIFESLPMTAGKKQSWWVDMWEQEDILPMRFHWKRIYHSRFLGRCSSISSESIFLNYDHSCDQRLPFVCERHNTTTVEPLPVEPHPEGLPCEEDFIPFRDKCYTLVKPLYLSFKQANEQCQSLKGSLLTIADQVEQDFVTSLLPGQPEKTWIGMKLKMREPKWVDDSPVSYINYNPLLHGMLRPMQINPHDPESMELCFLMFNNPSSAMMGTWDYTSCSDQQYLSVCQHYADKPEPPRFPSEAFVTNNHTFKLVQKNMTWFEALEECRNQSMDLASVADTLQQSVLTVKVSRARSPMWIGLFSEDEGVHYRWTDHSHTVFSRWSAEPTAGRCVYLDTDGFWKATECEEELAGAICHVPHETITTPEDIAVKCPHKNSGPNWIPFKNNCYTFQLASSRWDQFDKGQIHQTCKKLAADADILTIRNVEENEFVRQQLLPFKDLVQFIWLGMFMDDSDNQMKWHDGTNVQYTNWTNGRPNLSPGDTFLAGLTTQGLWEIITDRKYFSIFKQRSIVACKLDKDSKDQYKQPASDFEHYGNLSYHVITRKVTWFQALEECGRSNGHLASVHDAKHQSHMELIAKRDGFPLWIGLSSQDASGSQSYEWSDGTKFDYIQPMFSGTEGTSNSDASGGCVYVTTHGAWKKKDCGALVDGAICYNTTVTTNTQRSFPGAQKAAKHCPPSSGSSRWVEYQDHCYAFDMTFYNYSVYGMDAARRICEKLDAQLLTIKTKEENDFVSGYMEENPLITSRVWLGIDLDTHGQPVGWVDGSSLAFSNWAAKDSARGVRTAGQQKSCAVMVSADGGVWSRVSCEDSRSRIVCKAPARSGNAPVALVFFLVVLTFLLGAVGFVVYKKSRNRYSTTVRYKRTIDDADSTSIIEAE
ncbi:lymphocyte antigen 75 isoform X2 [Esox lucius]|uniref:lymphocyte antigen 75 isoform X2 n=1 Tax=Esox lucius TaxID=8010 RepID=UPI00147745D3|nr:lymphocyte antigen 75 isoform X2 [Esox lucius]